MHCISRDHLIDGEPAELLAAFARWDDIDWRKGTMQIRRLKGSIAMGFITSSLTKPRA